MRLRFLLCSFLVLSWGSQALADFNDKVFLTLTPKFPSDTSLELTAENTNDQRGYCSLRVDASYTLPGSTDTKRHLYLKTGFFMEANAMLNGFEFGRDEFLNLGIPGSAYVDATVIDKSCQTLPFAKLFVQSPDRTISLLINGDTIDTETRSRNGSRRTCKGVLGESMTQDVLKILNSTISQNFETIYGSPADANRYVEVNWNTATQSDRSTKAYGTASSFLPPELERFMDDLMFLAWYVNDCESEMGTIAD